MIDWSHPETGLWIGKYTTKGGTEFVAKVVLNQELWKTTVLRNGVVIDTGEWDGRKVAIGNAHNAVVRAMQLRSEKFITEMRQDEDQ